jgi:acetyltransferase EpsM
VADALLSDGSKIYTFIDSNKTGDYLNIQLNKNLSNLDFQYKSIIAIGDNTVRKKISLSLQTRFGTIKHSSALVSDSVLVGEGSMVLHQTVVQIGSSVGKHVIINTKASIDHDCIIENFVHIAPGSVLCGNVKVGEGTLIGAGSTIMPNIKIGKWCTIGAGSVIIKDIPDYAVVVGNPGRIIKYNQHG